jgi:hypothetical protein
MKNKNIENRAFILEISVTIENILSLFLSVILEIKSRDSSLSLGTKSSALGFNAKTNLLLDMKYIEKENKWKFQKFMEMRNQFAHNAKVDTFEKCFLLIGTREKLLSTYPNDKSLSLEERLKVVSIALGMEIISICKEILKKIGEEFRIEKSLEALACFTVAIMNVIKNSATSLSKENDLEEFLNKMLKSMPEEFARINKLSVMDKNNMIKDIFIPSEMPELFKTTSIKDYFSDEEIAAYAIKTEDTELKIF